MRPDYWRQYYKPWVKAIADYAHAKGLRRDLPRLRQRPRDLRGLHRHRASTPTTRWRSRPAWTCSTCGGATATAWASAATATSRSGRPATARPSAARCCASSTRPAAAGSSSSPITPCPAPCPGQTYDYIVKLVREYGRYPLQLGEFDEPITYASQHIAMKTTSRLAWRLSRMCSCGLRQSAERHRRRRTGPLQRRLDDARARRRRLDADRQRRGRPEPLGRRERRPAVLHLAHRRVERVQPSAETRPDSRQPLAESVCQRSAVPAGTEAARRADRHHGRRRRRCGCSSTPTHPVIHVTGESTTPRTRHRHARDLAHRQDACSRATSLQSSWTMQQCAPADRGLGKSADVVDDAARDAVDVVSPQRLLRRAADAEASGARIAGEPGSRSAASIARSAGWMAARDFVNGAVRRLKSTQPRHADFAFDDRRTRVRRPNRLREWQREIGGDCAKCRRRSRSRRCGPPPGGTTSGTEVGSLSIRRRQQRMPGRRPSPRPMCSSAGSPPAAAAATIRSSSTARSSPSIPKFTRRPGLQRRLAQVGRLLLVAEHPAALLPDDRPRRFRRDAAAVPLLSRRAAAVQGPREALPRRRGRLFPRNDDHLRHLRQQRLRLGPPGASSRTKCSAPGGNMPGNRGSN